MLHDVGKVAIPNEVLFKDGPLDEREWAVMREHPAIGERILRRTPELARIAPLVRHEHERWDGLGYPTACVAPRSRSAADHPGLRRLSRDDHRAPLRAPMSEEMAMGELSEGSGHQFDPTVVSTLMGVLTRSRCTPKLRRSR